MKSKPVLLTLLFLAVCLLGSGCAEQAAAPADDERTIAQPQPVAKLSFYLNESQSFETKVLNEKGASEGIYQIRRFYLLQMEGMGCVGKYSNPAAALTYRNHGRDEKEIFIFDAECLPQSVLEEGAVIELWIRADRLDYSNIIEKIRIIDYDADGTDWKYRS